MPIIIDKPLRLNYNYGMVSVTLLSDEEIDILIRFILSFAAIATATDENGENITVELNGGDEFFKNCKFGRYGDIFKEGGRFKDLHIFVGEALVFEGVTHEFYAAADINFIEREINSLGNMPELNAEILKKLCYAVPPDGVEKITANVILTEDNLLIDADGKIVRFAFYGDKTVEFNVDVLEAKRCGFVSGERYFINFFEYDADVQGVIPNGTVCDLYLELISEDGGYCNFEITADKIYCITDLSNGKHIL